MLTEKRVLRAERPLSTVTSRKTRYCAADPYPRFFFSFLDQRIPDVERGRGLESAQFGPSDAGALGQHRTHVPGAVDDVALVAVSRKGGSAAGVSMLDAADPLSCWE